MKRTASLLLPLLLSAGIAFPAKYAGPVPPKPDVPYLMHADNLIETEHNEAKENKRKGESVYTVAGVSSPARTPLAEPIFLLQADKLTPDKFELYKMDVKNGSREVSFPEKKGKGPRAFRLTVTPLGDRLYRIEVNEGMGLENGEYSLTPAGSNDVFCFEVY